MLHILGFIVLVFLKKNSVHFQGSRLLKQLWNEHQKLQFLNLLLQ